ncbi:MAG: alpha/beta hydrolase-fold protein [Gammaproteobacteria bacterium]|nr:alpha/beta hydrolase-fold protein [Gammaproteobacteria bacterium]
MVDDKGYVTKLSALIVVAILLTESAVASDLADRFLQGLGDSHYLRMDSETVGRDFHVFVMLPNDYEQHPKQTYPTVYILDGGALFPLLVAYYRYLNFGKEIPNAIIVGISYGSDSYEDGNYRSTDYTAESDERDYWGGAGTFQEFLSNEMIPYVESNYRSRSDRRVIFGHSIGGQFVLYTALVEPDLFWGHIASNPALHRNLPFFLQEPGSTSSPRVPSRLFVASGSMDDPEFRIPALKWIEHWSSKDNVPWQLETMTLDGHSHMSAPPASFRLGMRWLFFGQ